MKATTLIQQVQALNPQPDATVFVLALGRYVRVDNIVGAAVDPVITGPTSVCISGEEYVSKLSIQAALDDAYNRGRRDAVEEMEGA